MTPWFPSGLGDHGDRPALVTEREAITYRQLADRVEEAARRLGRERRLVMLAAANHPEAITLYLAALAAGHPTLVVAADNAEARRSLIDAYDPDVLVARGEGTGDGWTIDERRRASRHRLHPDLALLLSTSGSTGSPKLVRLSRENLESNAAAIAAYLDLRETDRATTSLPMAYCYGLSVINSHLHRGATLVLTDQSVVADGFWELFRRTESTSFAGVPYTFDLLDRVGFAGMSLPHLRYVTQAGGRLDPERVRRYADLGRRNGWELFVMYGQTEATARMAYLPPRHAASRPESVGVPIPGGAFEIEPIPGEADGIGELVYRGPNVMLGYADGPADLGLGRTVRALRTGDLARRGHDGMIEIVGRRSGWLKIAGLRIDPTQVERMVERRGARAGVVGTEDELVLVSEPGAPTDLPAAVRETFGLPSHAVRMAVVPSLPRLANGKLDRVAIRDQVISTAPVRPAPHVGSGTDAIVALYAESLGRDDVAIGDTFANLGGDSLSYVEVSLGLEQRVGRLPEGWEAMPIAELAALATPAAAIAPKPSWWESIFRLRSIEMTVALRAVAIFLIVATHIGVLAAPGGAHVLMAVAGFNFARFRLTSATRGERLRAQVRAVLRIALPAMIWVALAMLLLGQYEVRHLLLINALVRDELWGNLWFIELLVYILVAMAALLAIPAVDRFERRWPFAAATAVLAAALLFRFGVVDLGIPHTMPVLWLFAIGWAASRADRWWQRAAVLGVALAAVPGYFDALDRNLVILAGLVLLIGVRSVRVPAALVAPAGLLASASLYIYLVHWEVWGAMTGASAFLVLAACLAAGAGLWLVAARLPSLGTAAWRSLDPRGARWPLTVRPGSRTPAS